MTGGGSLMIPTTLSLTHETAGDRCAASRIAPA